MARQGEVGLARTGRSWAKITERVGLLLLIAVLAAVSWLLAVRAFEMLLNMLE
jgi:hypothetical protein